MENLVIQAVQGFDSLHRAVYFLLLKASGLDEMADRHNVLLMGIQILSSILMAVIVIGPFFLVFFALLWRSISAEEKLKNEKKGTEDFTQDAKGETNQPSSNTKAQETLTTGQTKKNEDQDLRQRNINKQNDGANNNNQPSKKSKKKGNQGGKEKTE